MVESIMLESHLIHNQVVIWQVGGAPKVFGALLSRGSRGVCCNLSGISVSAKLSSLEFLLDFNTQVSSYGLSLAPFGLLGESDFISLCCVGGARHMVLSICPWSCGVTPILRMESKPCVVAHAFNLST